MTTQFASPMTDNGEDFRVKPFPLSQLGDSWRTVNRDGKTTDRFWRNCTANHKGYGAAWAIENDRLYLTAFSAYGENWCELSMQDVFGTSKLFAFWYSGELHANRGKPIYGMFERTYEQDRVWRFEHGVVVDRFIRTNNTPEDLERARRWENFTDSL